MFPSSIEYNTEYDLFLSLFFLIIKIIITTIIVSNIQNTPHCSVYIYTQSKSRMNFFGGIESMSLYYNHNKYSHPTKYIYIFYWWCIYRTSIFVPSLFQYLDYRTLVSHNFFPANDVPIYKKGKGVTRDYYIERHAINKTKISRNYLSWIWPRKSLTFSLIN